MEFLNARLEMEAGPMKLAIYLALFIFPDLYAAVRRPMDDLAKYRSEVMEIGAKVSSLEKEIGSKNNLYISSLEQIKQFESDIKLYRDELEKKKDEINKSQLENRQILSSYLLESENEANEDWQRKVHLELLKRAQDKLKKKETELADFEIKVVEFQDKLSVLRKNEEELSQMIKELEARKNLTMETYLAKVEKKKFFESKVQAIQLNKKISKVKRMMSKNPTVLSKPDRKFSGPVDDFLGLTPSAKGVTFKYQALQPVKAVGKGRVIFAGDLAAYGQVILIDHGQELRTVLLGKMTLKVKKNDHVKSGDVVGYTLNETKEAQNLYFEVRKKNTAQNTILWLDQKGVSKI